MLCLVLLLAITDNQPQLVSVDRIEINENGVGEEHTNQIILWRWTSGTNGKKPGFRVAQWWILHEEPTVVRNKGKWVIYSRGLIMTTNSIRRTRTKTDPEVNDRTILDPNLRKPYFPPPFDIFSMY